MKTKETSKEALNEICNECNRTGDCDKKYGACPNFMKIWNDLEVLDILKQKPQSELHLVLLGKFKTYDEYLKYTDTDRWGWNYADKVFSKEEFNKIKKWLDEKNV